MLNLTAVLAVYRNLERTKAFVEDFVNRFKNVPLVISCVGSPAEEQRDLHSFVKSFDSVRLVTGSENKRVSFSENWNAAINVVETEKFVFVHNDMYIRDDFFENLDREIDDPQFFTLYTTVEPITAAGNPRPGKIVTNFGNDVEDFKLTDFIKFTDRYIQDHQNDPVQWGYGFYLSGYVSSLKSVGGFDQTRFVPIFCEDDDISLRIRLKGYRIKVSQTAVVYHFSAKTTAKMKAGELNSNRVFVRKWGFEARFLWSTGYEYPTEDIDIGKEKIHLICLEGVVTEEDVTNIEPLVDSLSVPSNLNSAVYKRFIPSVFWDKLYKDGNCPSDQDVDIVIRQVGPFDFKELANLVGTLRFMHRRLVPGSVARTGSFEVHVIRVNPEKREDLQNYLSLQKSTKYE